MSKKKEEEQEITKKVNNTEEVIADDNTEKSEKEEVKEEVIPPTTEDLLATEKDKNLRLFADIIPENYHNKILNQYIIGDDSKYLVFADNANTRLSLPKFPLFE